MKQFRTILKFELKNYFTNKVFLGVTIFLVAAILVVMFFPRFSELFDKEETVSDPQELPVMLLVNKTAVPEELILQTFTPAFPEYKVQLSDSDLEKVKEQIVSGGADCAIVLDSLTSYTYYVNDLSMYDSNTAIVNEVLQSIYRVNAMVQSGMTYEEAGNVLSAPIEHDVQTLGKDQMQNFFYTYIMIFALYMVILLYGQMVATNVATEKSSRAMEVLVTSAKPVSMMFGKVIASCIAGLVQIAAIFGSALLFFNLNRSYWDGGGIVASIFDMPVDLFVYMLIFFILGFFIYAFLFGAVGSTASKLEDINTSVMPITLLFVIGFLVVMFSMAAGDVNTVLIKVCSYIPFTSPMAMFTRIAMTAVPMYEIILSIVILIGSVIGVGVLSAKIYRVGVLLYGTPLKPAAILKLLKRG